MYCSTLYEHQIKLMRDELPQLNEEGRKLMETEISKRNASGRRVAGYLFPRITQVDLFSLMAAERQAHIDFSDAMKGVDLYAKFDRCKDAAFLPY